MYDSSISQTYHIDNPVVDPWLPHFVGYCACIGLVYIRPTHEGCIKCIKFSLLGKAFRAGSNKTNLNELS